MEYIVQGAKYIPETVSIILSFADVIPAGQVITGTPVITVTVETGIDPSPVDILYGGVSVIGGTAVEQRFRLGVEGVIYHLLYTIQTTGGDTIEKDCLLAILPSPGGAIPTWLPLWESTQLYPLQDTEGMQGAIIFNAGTLQVVVVPVSEIEALQGALLFTSGTLHDVVIPYNYSYEAIQGSVSFTSGTLVVVVIPYNYSYEAMVGDVAFLSGTLVVVVVPYSYSYEAMQGSAVFTGGTLV